MKIGIFGAEKQEIKLLEKHIKGDKARIAGITFIDGVLGGKQAVLACSGIGKVNAAMCTQILISEFGAQAVINTGTAGALSDDLNVFDVVAAVDAVQYDADAVHFGYAKGQIPGTKSAFWPASKSLRSCALKAFKALKPELSVKGIKMIEGRIASGDTFVSDKKLRTQIIKDFQPACVEMEGAAAAQVCVTNKIPYLILRSISDNAGKTALAKISYEEFSAQAAKTSALLVLKMIEMIKP